MESDYLTPALKYRIDSFMQLSRGENTGVHDRNLTGTEGFTSTPGDFNDGVEEIGIDGSAKKAPDTDSKIDKYLTDNLYYNSEHHQGKTNIIDREKYSRIAARNQTVEKLGENIPLFIRELPAYQNFSKESSYSNLTQLLKEIFDLSQALANKAYSPIMIDQLSQDQILKETSEFILMLFGDNGSGDLNLRGASDFDEAFGRILTRNLDIEIDEGKENSTILIAGLSLFLFMTLSKLYSENLNYYSLMERLVSILLDKINTLYLEFMFFLLAVENKSESQNLRLMQGVFQGMFFEKMSEIINRCCAYLDSYPSILISTLKYLYINLPSDQMLEIVRVILQSVINSKSEYFRSIILFIMKVFNPKIGFDLELNQTFKGMSAVYRSHLKAFMTEATKSTAGPLQSSFWPMHKIICQE